MQNSFKYDELSLEETYKLAEQCDACGLKKTRNKLVFSQGPCPCKIMCIGEAPGADEDEQGVPFVGRAGKLLTKMLDSIDLIRPRDVYIANTLKCRPPGNRTPAAQEIESCLPFLLKQLSEVKPEILLLLGSPAMNTILKPNKPISSVRGKWYSLEVTYQAAPLKVMTLFHPSYLLRNPSHETGSPKWLTWEDLKLVKEEYDKLT